MIRVKAAFVSLTPPAPPDDDGSYLQWHLLDHMPEQYQLPGLVLGTRWVADGECRDARIAGDGPLADVANVVAYLVGDPVQQTHDDFMELGRRLADNGRFPERRPSLELDFLALLRWYASPRVLVSGEVVPFRPHRGVVVIVEEPAGDGAEWLRWLHAEHHPKILQTPGVAGVWLFGSTGSWTAHLACQVAPRYITVIYLDDDPLVVSTALAPALGERWSSGAVKPLFAGPLRSMVRWDAWPA